MVNYKIAILVQSSKKIDQLKKSIESLLINAKNPENLLFAFRIDYEDTETKNFVYNLKKNKNSAEGALLLSKQSLRCEALYGNVKVSQNICIITGPHKDESVKHIEYNNLWRCHFKVADFFIPWEDDKMMETKNWDMEIFRFHESVDNPKIVCYINNWGFKCPVLSQRLLSIMGCISNSSNINEYLKYTCLISKVTIFIKTIKFSGLFSENELNQNFFNKPLYKILINKHIIKITIDSMYKPCEIIPAPKVRYHRPFLRTGSRATVPAPKVRYHRIPGSEGAASAKLIVELPKLWNLTKTINESKLELNKLKNKIN